MKRTLVLFLLVMEAGYLLGQLQLKCFNTAPASIFYAHQTKRSSRQFSGFQQAAPQERTLSQIFVVPAEYNAGAAIELFNYPPTFSRFYLQSATNSKKTLQLKKTKITLFVDESTPSTPGQISRFNSTECFLDSMKGDSVVVTLLSEEIDVDYRNKYINITNTYFGGSFNKVQKSIALKNIVYLQTRNPLRAGLSKAGTVLMGAAIVLIVGSPFAGMRQEGDARIAARERVFSTGLGCFATSVPLFIFGKPKKYRLSSNYKSRKNVYWNLLQH